MKRVLRILSLGLVICMLSSICVFADENSTFIDVPIGSSSYEAVEYLADKGVVKGCGDSLFNPNKNITLNQFAIMLVRAFGDVKYEDRPLPICYQNGWIDMFTVSQDPNGEITRGGLYQALFTVNNVSVFSGNGKRVSWVDYANIVEDLIGISNDNLENGITRGEVAELFYYFMTNDIVIELPEVLKDIVFENDIQNVGNYVAAFEKIPTVVLAEFKELGWKIDLTNKELTKYQSENGSVVNGLCDYFNKTISLRTPSSLVHEFGHFVDYISDFDLGIDGLFELEGAVFEEYKGHKIDNSHEYFAEFFNEYINLRNDSEKLNILREKMPETFKYFSDLEVNNWGIKD